MFRPIQYLTKQHIAENSVYFEINPSKHLKKYISCYWVSSVKILDNKKLTRIIPDGCVDIIFDLNTCKELFIGIMDKPVIEFETVRHKFLGIRFLPMTINLFLQEQANFLTNSSITLKTIIPELKFSKKLYKNISLNKKISLIEETLTEFFYNQKKLKNNTPLINSICQKHYIYNVQEICKELFVTERQLQRIFKKEIGISPKKFLNILRFQYAIQDIPNHSYSLSWSDIAIKNGYFDQAHFINEIKKLYGLTPQEIKMSFFSNTSNF